MDLRIAVVDETHVRAIKECLQETLAPAKARVEDLKARHTPVDYLLAIARRPRPISDELQTAKQEAAKIEETLRALEKIEVALGAEVEAAFESHVRLTVPEYVRGLSSMEHIEDWKRGLSRFETRLSEYLKALGQARSGATAGYNRTAKCISPSAEVLMQVAEKAAANLEEEVHFVNYLADKQEEMLKGTPCECEIPRVPIAPYHSWTSTLPKMEIAEMQVEFDRILKITETLKEQGIKILREAIDKTVSANTAKAHSFVLERLAALRDYADRNWLDPRQSKEVIDRLEKRLAGRQTIHFEISSVGPAQPAPDAALGTPSANTALAQHPPPQHA